MQFQCPSSGRNGWVLGTQRWFTADSRANHFHACLNGQPTVELFFFPFMIVCIISMDYFRYFCLDVSTMKFITLRLSSTVILIMVKAEILCQDMRRKAVSKITWICKYKQIQRKSNVTQQSWHIKCF